MRLHDVRVKYGQDTILEHMSLSIQSDECVAVVGRSGVGKSTLLRIIAGLESPVSGEVEVQSGSSEHPAMVFQEPKLVPWLKVWKNVVIGMNNVEGSDKGYALAQEMLIKVGLDGFADRYPVTLSGGQASRVSLARALVRSPQLLLLDEPFGALDALTRLEMQALLKKLQSELNCAVILVTHDVEEAINIADRVVVLSQTGDPGTGASITLDLHVQNYEAVDLKKVVLKELGVNID